MICIHIACTPFSDHLRVVLLYAVAMISSVVNGSQHALQSIHPRMLFLDK